MWNLLYCKSCTIMCLFSIKAPSIEPPLYRASIISLLPVSSLYHLSIISLLCLYLTLHYASIISLPPLYHASIYLPPLYHVSTTSLSYLYHLSIMPLTSLYHLSIRLPISIKLPPLYQKWNKRMLHRQCWDTNRNIKRLVYCRYG